MFCTALTELLPGILNQLVRIFVFLIYFFPLNLLYMYMLWFNLILGSNFISPCFKRITMHFHTPKQREIKFKRKIKLNHNI